MTQCVEKTKYNLFDCTGNFSTVSQMCGAQSDRFSTYSHDLDTYIEFSLDILEGYNKFTSVDFGQILVKPGYVLGVIQEGTGKIAIDRSASNNNPLSDYWLSGGGANNKDHHGGKLI